MKILVTKRFHIIKSSFICIAVIFMVFLSESGWGESENPLVIPKEEGSKNFDLEISQINSLAIKKYKKGLFLDAIEQFKKGLALAQQLRDPSQGILHYNLSLSLNKSEKHEEAAKQFNSAKKFARGNPKILKSMLFKMHECKFNSGIYCEKQAPVSTTLKLSK